MGVQTKPNPRTEFHGVYNAGNPISRPRDTAQVCENFRVMPGFWLRLRGGRIGRLNIGSGVVQQIHAFREPAYPGAEWSLAQIRYDNGSVKWHQLFPNNINSIAGFGADPFGVLEIPQSNDGAWTTSNPGAVCNIADRPVMYNGYGLRGADSRPGLSTYKGGVPRFYGLDAYAPGGRPMVSFQSNGSGVNRILTGSVKFYVGLHNVESYHFSNGVYAGKIDVAPGTNAGIVTISNLLSLTHAAYGSADAAELRYVFYATIEGYNVPYLIMNSTLTGPFTVPVGTASTTLAISPGTDNGWDLDLTHELETENFPPRRMRRVSYVNGRLYGNLLPTTGTGAQPARGDFERSFDYSVSAQELAGMTWSLAAGDVKDRDLLGDPLQCWPSRNFSPTPSGDVPLWHGPSPDDEACLVITGTSTFLLQEVADGLQQWFSISRNNGVGNPQTVVRTQYGVMWLDQQNQLVLLAPGSTKLQILSGPYQPLLSGTPTCADYILDPPNWIDRYQVWFSDGKSVVHDFAIGGEAYSLTGPTFTAAGTIRDALARRHHIVANRGIYTHESQAEVGLIPSWDETYVNLVTQTKTSTWITGRYRGNWDLLGSISVIKEYPAMNVVVDSQPAAAFGVKWWKNFQETSVQNRLGATIVAAEQVSSDSVKTVIFARHKPSAVKIEMTLSTHDGRITYTPLEQDGDLAANFYGCILAVDETVGSMGNIRG